LLLLVKRASFTKLRAPNRDPTQSRQWPYRTDEVFGQHTGATATEPQVTEDASGHLRIDVDKGNQASEGQDMIVLGHIAHPDVESEDQFLIKSLTSEGRSLEAVTDAEGSLWLIVGTDSGFEGLTTLYYSRISVQLSELDEG
jgi:hypothetical protein